MYFLIGKALKSAFGIPQTGLFFEVPIRESRVDILYVQTPEPYATALGTGIHAFEVKMRWDNDKTRLKKQVTDYCTCADYVWAVGINCLLDKVAENVGVMVFSTNGCSIGVVRPASHNHKRIDIAERQMLLSRLSKTLLKKARNVDEMAYVNQQGEVRIMIQEKLVVDKVITAR